MNPVFHMLFQQHRFLTNRLNEVLKKHALFSSQWSILFCLYQNGPMTMTQIWHYLNVEAPTVTRTVARLEELGWLIRKAGQDRREKIVYLTDMAMERYPEVEQSILVFEEEMVGGLSQIEQEQLIHLLKKMKGSV